MAIWPSRECMVDEEDPVEPGGLDDPDEAAEPAGHHGVRTALVLCLAVVLIGGGAVAVCAFGRPTPSPASELARAVTRSLRLKTATTDLHETMTLAGQTFELAGSGAMNAAIPASRTDATLWPPPGMGSLKLITQVSVGTTEYLRLSEPDNELFIGGAGQVAFGLPPGKVWLSMDLASAGVLSRSPVTGSGQPNLVGVLRGLTEDGGTVRSLGPGRVQGQNVVRYAVRTTRAEMLARLKRSTASPEVKQQIREAIPASSTTSVISVGRSGTLVQIASSSSLAAGGSTLVLREATSFSGWGQPVGSFDTPPAHLVEPASALRPSTSSA